MDEANGLTGLFPNVVDMEIPREFVSKNDAEKFRTTHTFNGLIVESQINIWEWIALC